MAATKRNSKRLIFYLILPALVVQLNSAPTFASNNLNVTVIREIDGFWNASPKLTVGKMPSKQMIQAAYKQFCKEYDYIEVSLASGKGWYFSNLSFIGESTKFKWVTDKNGEDRLEAAFTCRNSVNFKSLPNSNWYTVKFAWRSDAGTWWESHRITTGSLKKSRWGITLRINNEGVSKWTPNFNPELPAFKSLGCSAQGDDEVVSLEITNPIHLARNNSFMGVRALVGFLPTPSLNKSELADLNLNDFSTTDDSQRADGWILPEGLEPNLYFKRIKDGDSYAKVALVVPTSSYLESDFRFGPSLSRSGFSEVFTYMLTLTPSCDVRDVIPLGKLN